jgi:hypothetical protein
MKMISGLELITGSEARVLGPRHKLQGVPHVRFSNSPNMPNRVMSNGEGREQRI